MGTTIKGKKIATTKSGHKALGPPAVSNIPPVAPPTPAGVPAPFPYVAESSTGSSTSAKLVVGGGEALVEGSGMDVSQPGNQASQPAPIHDVVTQAVNAKVTVTSGAGSVTAGGKPVATTLDSAAMNVMAPGGQVAQVTNKLVEGGGADASSASPKDNRGSGTTTGEPVDVVTGAVVDATVDLSLPGLIPVEWKRLYSSIFADEASPLGRGGWTLTLHQWVSRDERATILRNDDGRNVRFPLLEPRGTAFERCKRLAITRSAEDAYTVFSLSTGLWRLFAPSVAGGRALLREVRDAWGNSVQLRYTGERLTSIVDTALREIRLAYDAAGRVVRVEVIVDGTSVQTVSYAYTPTGELTRVTDAIGRTEAYAYDGAHRMIAKTLTNGVRFHYDYERDTGRCVRTWGDGGIHNVELDFDLEARTTHIHGMPAARRFTWNREGCVEREETLDGNFVDATSYDEDLFVIARTNAAGEATRYEYDARGNRTAMIDPAGNRTVWEYRDDLVARSVTPDGLVTTYGHDEHGALAHVTYPARFNVSIARDARGRVVSVQGPEGTLLAREYDAHHNVVRETDACGAVTAYAYDALGRPVSRTDPVGRVTRIERDAVGQVTIIHHADGTRTQIAYDARGNVAREVDPLGRVTLREYGGTGVLTKMTMPNEQAWTFGYDRLERLVEIQNPKHEIYRIRYDPAGRVEREETFDGRVLRYQYSTANRLARIEYPDDTWRAFHYDVLGNVVLETSPHGPQRYLRDALGRVREAVVEEYSGKIVVTFERDTLGRVVAESQNGEAIRYEYDVRGRRTSRMLPSGEVTRYAYDPCGRAIAVDHDGYRLLFQRDAAGQQTRLHIERGRLDIMSAFGANGEIAEQHVVAPTGDGSWRSLARRHYTYDAFGRLSTEADDRWGIQRYEHDAIDQLASAQRITHRQIFDYDAAGSVQGIFGQLDTTRIWSVAKGNLLQRTPDAAYEYDERHRRVRKIQIENDRPTGAVTEYAWDCRDRLREVKLPGGDRILLTYDAFGRRVRKEVVRGDRSEATSFLWDGNALAREGRRDGSTRVFAHMPGTLVPLIQQEGRSVFTYVSGRLGVPAELLDSDGNVAWSAAFSPWGSLENEWRAPGSQAVRSPFRLEGMFFDDETGLCQTRFRYFDPETARWLSGDPIGICGGSNLFGFDGNPVLDVDPYGLLPWRWDPNGMGHHLVWRNKANSAGLSDLGTEQDTPTFFPDPYQPGMHEDLHRAQAPYIGSRSGPWEGTQEDLLLASEQGLADVEHVRGDLKIPRTGEVLAENVTPREAYQKLMEWHRAQAKRKSASCG